MTGHIRERSTGSFELRYRAGGKIVTATFRGSRKAADQELRRLLTAVDNGAKAASKDTVGAWLTRWLAMIEDEKSPLTHRLYKSQVERYLRPAFGDERLAKLSPDKIQATWSTLTHLAPSSRRVLHHILNSSLSRAVELELIQRNPCIVLRRRLPKAERTEKAVLTPAVCVEVIDWVRGTPMHAPTVLGLALGARRGEIAALRWHHISDDGVVTIAEALRELKASDIRKGGTKTGKTRLVKLPAYAVDELRAWRRLQAEWMLALGKRVGIDDFICTDRVGQLMTPSHISDGFRAVKKRLGLPISFHGLRHTSASTALATGATVKQVQERLGHSRPSMTLDVYGHLIEGLSDDAAERLDKAMRDARRGKQ